MSKSSLNNCVRLIVQDKLYLTVQAHGQSLPKAHKTLLLPVEPEDKIETAEEIVDLSYRDARDWIKQKYQSETSWLRLYTIWNFPKRNPDWGLVHDGNIPGEILANLLYYYTNEGDLIVDPFVGGGSTIAVCQEFNRRCWVSDLTPGQDVIEKYNVEINEHDAIEPFLIDNANFVFLDPPYFQQKKGEYSDKANDLSNCLTVEIFNEKMRLVLRNSFTVLVDGGYCAKQSSVTYLIRASKLLRYFEYLLCGQWSCAFHCNYLLMSNCAILCSGFTLGRCCN